MREHLQALRVTPSQTNLEERDMKSKAVFLGVVVAAFTVPAYAGVSQETRDACWRAAERVSPILTQPEKEQYVANCLANASAGTPPPKNDKRY